MRETRSVAEALDQARREGRLVEGPPARIRGAPTSEAEFMEQVIFRALMRGWKVFHVHDSRRSPPGFPDLTMAVPGRLVFAELKSQDGALTPEQRDWLDVLQQVGASVEAYCWRPSDLPEIERILQ